MSDQLEANSPEAREDARRDAYHLPIRMTLVQRMVEGGKQGLLIAVIVVAGLMGVNFASGDSATHNRLDHNAEVTREGIRGIVCILALPTVSAPDGRTDEQIDECLSKFTQMIDDLRAAGDLDTTRARLSSP